MVGMSFCKCRIDMLTFGSNKIVDIDGDWEPPLPEKGYYVLDNGLRVIDAEVYAWLKWSTDRDNATT
jgi:hypothetical protein